MIFYHICGTVWLFIAVVAPVMTQQNQLVAYLPCNPLQDPLEVISGVCGDSNIPSQVVTSGNPGICGTTGIPSGQAVELDGSSDGFCTSCPDRWYLRLSLYAFTLQIWDLEFQLCVALLSIFLWLQH